MFTVQTEDYYLGNFLSFVDISDSFIVDMLFL